MPTLAERLNAKTKKRNNGCWEWQGYLASGTGYGVMSVGNRPKGVHRVAYELNHGPIPKGMCVCHTCDNRKCIRPDHLFLGTKADNLEDMRAKGRQAKGKKVSNPGSTNGNSRITEDDVRKIRQQYEDGVAQVELARRFGIDQTNVSCIVRRVTWKHSTSWGKCMI